MYALAKPRSRDGESLLPVAGTRPLAGRRRGVDSMMLSRKTHVEAMLRGYLSKLGYGAHLVNFYPEHTEYEDISATPRYLSVSSNAAEASNKS